MQKLTFGLAAAAVAGLVIGTAFAQDAADKKDRPRDRQARPDRPDDRSDRGGRRPEGRPARTGRGDRPDGPGLGRDGFRPNPPPLMVALDTDKDGVISAKEIENAVAALKTLDKNNDGKLTQNEIRPDFSRDGRPGDAGRDGRPGDAGRGRPGQGGPGGSISVERLLQNDKNKDGKLTKDELPERMQRALQFADTNKDGALDKDELEKLVERIKSRQGGRPEGRRPGAEGGRRPDGDGNRRPNRPRNE